jgi:predicted ATPase/DNA-binding SARP family transcriptional activator
VNPEPRLCLFANPHWQVDSSQNQPLAQGNYLWLLTYLAVQADWVERKELAELLWDDAEQGLNNLRQLLHRSKNTEWASCLEVSQSALRFRGVCDVALFRAAQDNADWETALHWYSGELLAGLRPPGVPNFANWLETERSLLQAEWREALNQQIVALDVAGESAKLFVLLQTQLEIDPYNEEALLRLLRLAQPLAQEKLALRLFQTFKQRLHQDLGVEPLPETLAAAEQVLGGLEAPAQKQLLGRESEIGLMLEQLRSMRLITLRGAGGMGKTILAKKILELARPNFLDGAVWVALQPIQLVDDVPLAIAAALELTMQAGVDDWTQICQCLAQKRMLLVLDNVEHLPQLGQKIADLLEASAYLKILATSRISLEVPQESIVSLQGLDYPETADLEAMQHANAVRLFVRQAAQRKAGFKLTQDNHASIWRICHLLQGLPLGLVLSAAWVSELSPEALVQNLETNADLHALQDDQSAAHHSLRMVFEHSWELLEEGYQQALSSVCVFRGGFDRRAAVDGLGVSPRALLALVGRSLLQNLSDGRFDVHPAVQLFALQKLSPSQLHAVQQQHTQYFMQLAESAELPLWGGQNQVLMLKKITAEHQNLMALCDHATDSDAVLRTLAALWRYFFIKDQMLQGLQRLQTALAGTSTHPELLARAGLAAGIQSSVLGQFDQSNADLKTALHHAETLENQGIKAQILNWQGTNFLAQGQHQAALLVLEQAEAIQRHSNHGLGRINTLKDLGRLYTEQNNWERAKPYFEQSLELAQQHQDLLGASIALLNLAQNDSHLPSAKQMIEQSMTLKQQLGDTGGMALLHHANGMIALAEQDLERAKQHFLESLELRVRHGRQREAALAVLALAAVDFLQHQPQRALVLYAATSAVLERSRSSLPQYQMAMAQQLESQARTALGQAAAEEAQQRGRAMSLEEVCDHVRQTVVVPGKEVVAMARRV